MTNSKALSILNQIRERCTTSASDSANGHNVSGALNHAVTLCDELIVASTEPVVIEPEKQQAQTSETNP